MVNALGDFKAGGRVFEEEAVGVVDRGLPDFLKLGVEM